MRLIDADKLKAYYSWWSKEEREVFDTIVDLQPTVDLPAERSGKTVFYANGVPYAEIEEER